MTIDHKQALLDILDVLRKKEIVAKQPFKAKAYANVSKNIQLITSPITCLEDLNDVKGIGESIRLKFLEYFNTGKVNAAETAKSNVNNMSSSELMLIHGIGPAKAKSLIEEHNIKSIQDLESKPELLNDKQKIGLKYWRDFQERIPRKEMVLHEQQIRTVIQTVDPNFTFEVTGSYRRFESTSGDIDVLITHKEDLEDVEQLFANIVEKLKNVGYICDTFAEGGKKCLAVCRLKHYRKFRRIDLLYTKKREYPFAVLYFTGNAEFNVAMRVYCLTKGYSLSEHGLKDEKTGDFIETGVEDERQIFEFLGLKYVEPKDRNGNAVVPIHM